MDRRMDEWRREEGDTGKKIQLTHFTNGTVLADGIPVAYEAI